MEVCQYYLTHRENDEATKLLVSWGATKKFEDLDGYTLYELIDTFDNCLDVEEVMPYGALPCFPSPDFTKVLFSWGTPF